MPEQHLPVEKELKHESAKHASVNGGMIKTLKSKRGKTSKHLLLLQEVEDRTCHCLHIQAVVINRAQKCKVCQHVYLTIVEPKNNKYDLQFNDI